MGPSAYQEKDRASEAKSGAGLSISIPIYARSIGVDRWRARIDDVLAGRTVGGFALTEPEAGSDVASLRAKARREGDGWRLDGEKTFISNVGIARYFVVFANADPPLGKKGISAFLAKRAPRFTGE